MCIRDRVDTVSQLYPEYYILKVNGFNQVAKSPLEEWIYYLNTGEIPSTATAPGLEEARERLKLDSMTKDELAAYYRHLDNIVIPVSYTHLGLLYQGCMRFRNSRSYRLYSDCNCTI